MGEFRIFIRAVGGHGCQRELKDGAAVGECSDPRCPDCAARRFVKQLQADGNNVQEATVQHWAGSDQTVIDNLLTGHRRGSF